MDHPWESLSREVRLQVQVRSPAVHYLLSHGSWLRLLGQPSNDCDLERIILQCIIYLALVPRGFNGDYQSTPLSIAQIHTSIAVCGLEYGRSCALDQQNSLMLSSIVGILPDLV